MSVWEPATFWGKYVNVVSGVELIWSWSYSILRTCFASIDSIYLLWFHSSIMDIPRSLQFGDSIGSKNHQRHFPNCINLSQSTPTNTHTYIYIYIYPWIARNLLCYNFYQFFSPKKWAKHRRCFQISSARAMEFQMSHTQKGRCHATTDGTLLLEVGKATIFCWVPLGKLRLCEVV